MKTEIKLRTEWYFFELTYFNYHRNEDIYFQRTIGNIELTTDKRIKLEYLILKTKHVVEKFKNNLDSTVNYNDGSWNWFTSVGGNIFALVSIPKTHRSLLRYNLTWPTANVTRVNDFHTCNCHFLSKNNYVRTFLPELIYSTED